MKFRIISFIFVLLFMIFFLSIFFNNGNKIIVENTFKVIDNSTIEKDGKIYNYQLLRLKGKNVPSYGIYYPNGDDAILITEPYGRIDWSGEKVDSYHWNSLSVKDSFENANLYLINNFSVLIVFARFYEGGDINNDIEDIVAGLTFLENKSDKIGIIGGSWGGFESLYGAINSPVKPNIGVAYYPVTDMGVWINWTYNMPEEDFWGPYQERIIKGSKGNYSKWDYDYINKNLETDFLIVHAFEDTLVPFESSYKLVNLSDKVNGMWLHKMKGSLSHGESLVEEKIPFEHTVSGIYLMTSLTNRSIISIIDKEAMQNYINDLELFKKQGQNISWSIILFDNIFKPNVSYYDIETFELIKSENLRIEFEPKLSKLGIILKDEY